MNLELEISINPHLEKAYSHWLHDNMERACQNCKQYWKDLIKRADDKDFSEYEMSNLLMSRAGFQSNIGKYADFKGE